MGVGLMGAAEDLSAVDGFSDDDMAGAVDGFVVVGKTITVYPTRSRRSCIYTGNELRICGCTHN